MSGTFGLATIGGSWAGSGTPYKFANKLGPIPAGTTYRLTAPAIYMRSNPATSAASSQTARLVLWDDGATPGDVVNVGSAVTYIGGASGTGTAANWQPFTFEGAATSLDLDAGASDRYLWIGVIDTGTNDAIQIASDTGAAGANQYKMDSGYATIADGQTFGTPDGSDTTVFSIRVEWEEIETTMTFGPWTFVFDPDGDATYPWRFADGEPLKAHASPVAVVSLPLAGIYSAWGGHYDVPSSVESGTCCSFTMAAGDVDAFENVWCLPQRVAIP